MDLHLKNKKDLEEQIAEANKNLNELKKRNMFNTVSQSSGNEKSSKD